MLLVWLLRVEVLNGVSEGEPELRCALASEQQVVEVGEDDAADAEAGWLLVEEQRFLNLAAGVCAEIFDSSAPESVPGSLCASSLKTLVIQCMVRGDV